MRDKWRLITFLYVLLRDYDISRDEVWAILNDYVKKPDGGLTISDTRLLDEARVMADEICR